MKVSVILEKLEFKQSVNKRKLIYGGKQKWNKQSMKRQSEESI